MPQSEARQSAYSALTLIACVLAFLALGLGAAAALVAAYDPAFLEPPADATNLASIWLNAIPAVLLALLLLVLTRRGALSLAISLALLFLVYVANATKLELLETPVLPGDLQLLAHLGDDGWLLLRYASSSQVLTVIGVLTAWGLLALFERPWPALVGKPRAVLLVAALAVNASLFFNVRPWSTVYAAHAEGFEAWSPASSALRNGVIVTLLSYTWRLPFSSAPVDHAAAERLLRTHAPAPPIAEPLQWPDIVVLQSESLFDPARLKGIDDGRMLPELHRLMANNRHGDLWVPAYGGGTIRTEFEVLTGLAMREFPEIDYPYFSLTSAGPVASLASTLRDRGYRTIAVHPNSRDFWNRAAAFEQLGFQEFDAAEQFAGAEQVGYYPSDKALVDHMLARLDEGEGPTFLFAISIENHGPYHGYPNADPERLAAIPVPSGISEGRAARLRGYFYHLENADRELGRLVEFLRKRQRRSVLLFYGDHLPAMPRTYAELGFDDGAEGPLQPVPWLLVDSADPGEARRGESTASFYLPALLLDAAGVDDHGYFRMLEALRRIDSPGPTWTPVEQEGLRAVMRLRQRGELALGE